MNQVGKTVVNKNSSLIIAKIILKWLIIVFVLLVVLFLATTPLRSKAAKHFIRLGDGFLTKKDYARADLSYEKAGMIKPGDRVAKERIALTKQAQINVLALEPFFQEQNDQVQLELIAKATNVPPTAKQAVINSKELIEKGEYQLAAIAAQTAIEMDESYQVAKDYKAIALKLTPGAIN